MQPLKELLDFDIKMILKSAYLKTLLSIQMESNFRSMDLMSPNMPSMVRPGGGVAAVSKTSLCHALHQF